MLRVSYEVLLLGCPQECLSDRDAMIRFLEQVVPEIGMTPASAPLVVEIASPRTPFIGLSGTIIIKESHVGCHFWLEWSRVDISINSCKPFDARRATAFAAAFFQARSAEVAYTERFSLDDACVECIPEGA